MKSTVSRRDIVAKSKRKARQAVYEVGKIPEPANWELRKRCAGSLELFIREYGAGFDHAHFSGELFPDQRQQIADIQTAVEQRGCYAFANFRGGGKTSIIAAARLWLILYGHADWLVTLLANNDATNNVQNSMVAELLLNDKLMEDFPEACIPVRHCEGNGSRLRAQCCNGVRTDMKIRDGEMVFPNVKHAAPWQQCAGSVCEFAGRFTNSLRGKNKGGRRPQVVFFDDIESDSSASSNTISEAIEQVLTAAAGLGSHFRDIACIWIGTVISTGCLMDRYSNPTLHPSWNGRRYRYLLTPPTNAKLWQQYVDVRKDGLTGGPKAARAFYEQHLDEMREGASVAWPDGYDRGKYVDALEKFFALQADKGLKYVACELQNDPSMLSTEEDRAQLTEEWLVRRTSGLERGEIPDNAVGLCGFIDVQDPMSNPLYWELDWFTDAFGGGLYAHGTWPLDGTPPCQHYSRQADRNIGKDEALSLAMQDLVAYLKNGTYKRNNGTGCRLFVGADTGDGVHQSVVFAMSRQEGIIPTKGVGLKTQEIGSGRNTKPVARGQDWYTSYHTDQHGNVAEVLNYESRRWKSFARDRLQTPRTSANAWQFWGHDGTILVDLIHHYCAEKSKEMATPEGEKYTVWTPYGENHWWDCHVGCHVLASYALGLKLRVDGGLVQTMGPVRRRVPYKLTVVPV